MCNRKEFEIYFDIPIAMYIHFYMYILKSRQGFIFIYIEMLNEGAKWFVIMLSE